MELFQRALIRGLSIETDLCECFRFPASPAAGRSMADCMARKQEQKTIRLLLPLPGASHISETQKKDTAPEPCSWFFCDGCIILKNDACMFTGLAVLH